MDFRVQLDTFRGPLDLLLYLVRKHEVDVADIPIALITDQYLAHLEVLQQLDVNEVGDFLELASSLIEIKSQMVLPRGGEETEQWDDPRDELVARLLEYKKYKDAASVLEERSRDWQQHYSRLASDLPPRQVDPAGQPIREVELWDLVSAFGRILRESQAVRPQAIVYDETPIQVYMQRIHVKLASDREKPYLLMGRLCMAMGRAGAAEKMFTRAIQIQPNCVEALRELRLINMRRGRRRGLIGRILRR